MGPDGGGGGGGTAGDASVGQDGGEPLDAGPLDDATSDATTPPDELAPVLTNFRVETEYPNRVQFDSSKPLLASQLGATGFTVSGKTISGIVVNAGATTGHYLTVAAPFTFWDYSTVRLEGGTGAVHDFSLTRIVNSIAEPSAGVVRYASASGSGNGDGTSESNAWSYSQAFSNAKAGMTVYMKAGSSSAQLSLSGGGTASAPIKFIGYKTAPGDITSLYYSYGDGGLSSTEMPTLNGGDRSSGSGISIENDTNYVIFKNIQVTNYLNGVESHNNASKLVFERILIKDVGTTSAEGYGFEFVNFLGDSHKNRFTDCTVINATHINYAIYGNGNLVQGCSSYCDEVDPSNVLGLTTDYYFYVRGNDNQVLDSRARRLTYTGHGGHGFTTKYVSEHNLFDNCLAINMMESLDARHSTSRFNVFKNCEVDGETDIDNGQWRGGITLTSGANHNVFERIYLHDLRWALSASSSGEDVVAAGSDNVFRNIVAKDITSYVVRLFSDTGGTAAFDGNRFENWTIQNAPYFFTNDGGVSSSGNEVVNCIFSSVAAQQASQVTGFTFDHNDFHGGFAPVGTSSHTLDPQFVDLAGFVPKNAGLKVGVALPGVEYDGSEPPIERDANAPTIGARENSN